MSTGTVANVSELPFLDGRPKKLLIAGEWVEAVSGTTFPSINPSTGKVIAEVAEGAAEDANPAVAAARQAFEGARRTMKPAEPPALAMRLADVVHADHHELPLLHAV